MKKHLSEIDILRGMAIVMVILYHSIIVYPIDLHEIVWCKTLHDFLWLIEMPLFFLVSGFCFSYKEKFGKYLWKKVKRILIPHFIFCGIDMIPRMIPNDFVNEKTNFFDGMKDLLLYGGTDWFLWTLFLIMAMFPLIHWIMKKGIWQKVIVTLVIVLIYVFNGQVTNLFLLSNVAKFLIYFFIGYLVSKLDYEKVKKIGKNGIVAMIALFLLCGSFYVVELHHVAFELPVAIFAAIICYYLSLQIIGFFQKLLVECGNYSLQMFLINGYALVLTRTIVVTFLGIQQPIIVIVCNFVLDLIILLVIAKYFFARWNILRVISGIPKKQKAK